MITATPEVSTNKKPEFFILPQSKFLEDLNKTLYHSEDEKFYCETVYRKHSSQVDCVHFFDKASYTKLKTVYYDYFDGTKVKSIDEFDPKTGTILRSTNFTLYKSITEYNPKTGKKLKTVNYSLRDNTKIASIHEYHSIYDKITRVSIFRADGKSLSMVKEINPLTEQVEQCINYKRDSNVVSSVSKYEFQGDKMVKTTCYYTDHTKSFSEFRSTTPTSEEKVRTAKLIDNLFQKNLNFATLQL